MSSETPKPLTQEKAGEWLIGELLKRGCSLKGIRALDPAGLDFVAETVIGRTGDYTPDELEIIAAGFDVANDFDPRERAECREVAAEAVIAARGVRHGRLKAKLRNDGNLPPGATDVERIFYAALGIVRRKNASVHSR